MNYLGFFIFFLVILILMDLTIKQIKNERNEMNGAKRKTKEGIARELEGMEVTDLEKVEENVICAFESVIDVIVSKPACPLEDMWQAYEDRKFAPILGFYVNYDYTHETYEIFDVEWQD